jgi:hypothetical protein
MEQHDWRCRGHVVAELPIVSLQVPIEAEFCTDGCHVQCPCKTLGSAGALQECLLMRPAMSRKALVEAGKPLLTISLHTGRLIPTDHLEDAAAYQSDGCSSRSGWCRDLIGWKSEA